MTSITAAARLLKRKLPQVDVPIIKDNDELRRFGESIKEHLRMYEGDSGAPKERFVTIEELEHVGLVTTKLQQGFASIDKVLGEQVSPVPSSNPPPGTGGGGGVRTLRALDDTSVDGISGGQGIVFNGSRFVPKVFPDFDLADATRYDMMYYDGNNWRHTDEQLQWNPDDDYLQLANEHSINWLDSDGDTLELAILGAAVSGDADIASVVLLTDVETNDGAGDQAITVDIGGHVLTAIDTGGGLAEVQAVAKFGTFSLFCDDDAGVNEARWGCTTNSTDFDFGSGDFTLECHIRFKQLSSTFIPLMSKWIYGDYTFNWQFNSTSERFIFDHSLNGTSFAGGAQIQWPSSVAVDTWYHVACARDSNTIRFFVDGVLCAVETDVTGDTFYTADQEFEIMSQSSAGGAQHETYVDNIRVTKGVARYTATFTPPTAPYPTTGNVTAGFTLGDPTVDMYLDANEIRIRGATPSTNYLAIDHDDTDINIVGNATTDINITGITAIKAGTVDADFDAITAISYEGILSTDLDSLREMDIGVALDSPDVSVSAAGGVITFTLEDTGTGDIRFYFSDGVHTHDCTAPIASVVLTAGTDASPTLNYVYILQSDKALTRSTAGWPAAEHAPLATVLCQSAASLQTDGAYKLHAWTDHTWNDETGHIAHLNSWIRNQPATWISGTLCTTSVGAATFDIAVATGSLLQLHDHTFPAFDTATGSEIMIVNQNAGAYDRVGNMVSQITDAAGVTMSGKYYNLVVWAVVSEDDADSQLMVNLPTASYNTSAAAILDADATAVYDIPSDFIGCGFLVARLTCRHQVSGNTYSISQNQDLRGTVPSTSAGGTVGGGVTTFGDLSDGDDTGVSDNDLLFYSSGVWIDTAGLLTWDGSSFKIWDGGGTDNIEINHDGNYGYIGGTNMSRIYFQDAGDYRFFDATNAAKFEIQVGTTDIFFHNSVEHIAVWWEDGDGTLYYTFNFNGSNGEGFTVHRGNKLALRGITGANELEMRHDNTDLSWVANNTTDWNITGITALNAGSMDADFDAITATSYGGIAEADLVDKSVAETIAGDWTWEGRLVTDDSTTTRAGLNIPIGVAPTSPVQGDIWSTAADLFMELDGSTETNAWVSDISALAFTTRIGHTYAVVDKIKTPSGQKNYIVPFFVALAPGQAVNLVKARHRINAGGSVTCKLQKNDVDIAGFTGISVTTTSTTTDPADVPLADDDKLALVITGISGVPQNMTFTIFIDAVV